MAITKQARIQFNGLGEPHCHTVDDVREILDNHESNWEVHALKIINRKGTHNAYKAYCEIVENKTGDLVVYLEGEDIAEIALMLKRIGLD